MVFKKSLRTANAVVKSPKKVTMGKKSRKSGADFERRVRKDLVEKGWIVDKWSNNVSDVFEQDIGEYVRELVPAKHKFRGIGIPMSMGTGFPDFSCHVITEIAMDIIGVEAKTNGYLDKEEREKCEWLLKENIFTKILIASKEMDGRKIKVKYDNFLTKYGGKNG